MVGTRGKSVGTALELMMPSVFVDAQKSQSSQAARYATTDVGYVSLEGGRRARDYSGTKPPTGSIRLCSEQAAKACMGWVTLKCPVSMFRFFDYPCNSVAPDLKLNRIENGCYSDLR